MTTSVRVNVGSATGGRTRVWRAGGWLAVELWWWVQWVALCGRAVGRMCCLVESNVVSVAVRTSTCDVTVTVTCADVVDATVPAGSSATAALASTLASGARALIPARLSRCFLPRSCIALAAAIRDS